MIPKENRPTLSQLKNELQKVEKIIRIRRIVISTLAVLLVAAAAAVILVMLYLPVLSITGSSMKPSFSSGDIVVGLNTDQYKKGDVIAFYYGNEILIKRVVGTEGDWIDIDENGHVYVNEMAIDEPYVESFDIGNNTDIILPYQVGENRYFVMGDARKESVDSRNSLIGCVKHENVIGKIWIRVWPFNRISVIDRIDLKKLLQFGFLK